MDGGYLNTKPDGGKKKADFTISLQRLGVRESKEERQDADHK